MQTRLDFRLVPVPDRLDEQIAEPLLTEELAEDVENAATEGLPLQLNFFKEAFVNVSFACLFRQQIPEMAYFSLPNAVYPSETLFQPIRIPGQIVVDHQVRAL